MQYNTIFTSKFNYVNRELPYDGRFSNYEANYPSASAFAAELRWSQTGVVAVTLYYIELLYASIDHSPRDVPLSNAGTRPASVDVPQPLNHPQYSPIPPLSNSKSAAYNQQYCADSGQPSSLYSSPEPNQQWGNESPLYPGAPPTRRDDWQQQLLLLLPQRSRMSNEYEPTVYEHTFGPDALVAASPQSARRGRNSSNDAERTSKRGAPRRPVPQSLLYLAGDSRPPHVGVSPTESGSTTIASATRTRAATTPHALRTASAASSAPGPQQTPILVDRAAARVRRTCDALSLSTTTTHKSCLQTPTPLKSLSLIRDKSFG